MLAQLIQWRREFHRFPETGWAEFLTTTKLCERLSSMGFEVLVGRKIINPDFVRGRVAAVVQQGLDNAITAGANPQWLAKMEEYTGCVAIWDTGRKGPTTALRFDIDCVNVHETHNEQHIPNQEAFRSQQNGLMHACGHDGHTAIGLGVAQWISENATQLSGKIKLIFQPAEEGVRGAAAIAASGIVDDVDYFAGSHLSFCADSGTIITNPTNFLCTTKIDLRYRGKPAHAGASPHLGQNALLAAAHCVTQLHSISRHGDGMTRINVGVFNAGEGRNVIPSYAQLQLEVRGENAKINQYMVDNVMSIAQGIATSFGVELETEVMGEAVDLINDDELITLIGQIAKNTHAVQNVVENHPFNGSEDATILGKRVQQHGGKAIYFIVGADRTAGHHQAEFDFDERQLLTAYEIYTALLRTLNQ
ncbi:M20 family metallo-hydrolase [Spirabiliibacterium falconis]|uniref:M20 family metallo-hydrolase n=1 Tax=Spirabiliibacterium falconis TaxID=572023 RepID=UPI001AAD52E8|nr:M20 family metallo-hydrolase [Spirabiliibacterium falconis]MBE2893755.1 M20 family metallo-hydrolase [Spirabiliibacterium falconis]